MALEKEIKTDVRECDSLVERVVKMHTVCKKLGAFKKRTLRTRHRRVTARVRAPACTLIANAPLRNRALCKWGGFASLHFGQASNSKRSSARSLVVESLCFEIECTCKLIW